MIFQLSRLKNVFTVNGNGARGNCQSSSSTRGYAFPLALIIPRGAWHVQLQAASTVLQGLGARGVGAARLAVPRHAARPWGHAHAARQLERVPHLQVTVLKLHDENRWGLSRYGTEITHIVTKRQQNP